MTFQHYLLAFLWILYCSIHSLLASIPLKLFFEKKSQKLCRYYRLVYSIFAGVTLITLLIYQFSFQSVIIIQSTGIEYVAVLILIIPGLSIMALSIIKYFRLLSGIRSLYEPSPKIKLRVDGIHKYVRHPLYTGTLIFIWGLLLLFPYLNNLISVVVITLYVMIGIRLEEKKLVLQFGEIYKRYQAKVPMLIPKLKHIINKKGGLIGHP